MYCTKFTINLFNTKGCKKAWKNADVDDCSLKYKFVMQIPVKVSSRTTRIKTNLQIKELPLFMIIVYFLHFYQKLNNIYTIINF